MTNKNAKRHDNMQPKWLQPNRDLRIMIKGLEIQLIESKETLENMNQRRAKQRSRAIFFEGKVKMADARVDILEEQIRKMKEDK
jgi:hypothetical protein